MTPEGKVSSGPIFLDELRCAGNELSLVDCPSGISEVGLTNCDHSEDVWVKCRGGSTGNDRQCCYVICVNVDTNECKVNNGGCEHNCTNTIGSFECNCYDGFNLTENSLNCTGM